MHLHFILYVYRPPTQFTFKHFYFEYKRHKITCKLWAGTAFFSWYLTPEPEDQPSYSCVFQLFCQRKQFLNYVTP